MKYKVIDGVVLCQICDEYVIIASKGASEFVPKITQLNDTGAYIWKMLESGLNTDEIIQSIHNEYEVGDSADIAAMVNDYISNLEQSGFLIKE